MNLVTRKTQRSPHRRAALLNQRAEMLAYADDPKTYLWEITCDGYEAAGAPKGTMCKLDHRPAQYGKVLVLILIHNKHGNHWLFGYLQTDGVFDYLFEPDRPRLMKLTEGAYTLCGVLVPLDKFESQPAVCDDKFLQMTKQLTPFIGSSN